MEKNPVKIQISHIFAANSNSSLYPSFFLASRAQSWEFVYREVALHGILPSLAGGEWPGRCDLYCAGRTERSSLEWPTCNVCLGRSCSTPSRWHLQMLLYGKSTQPTVISEITHGSQGPALHVKTACWTRESACRHVSREVHVQRDGRGLSRVLSFYCIVCFMPSLRDIARGGVFCTSSTRTSATAAGFGRSSQLSSSRPGQAVRSVREDSMGWVTLFNPARRAAVRGQTSSFQPHCPCLPRVIWVFWVPVVCCTVF